MRHLKGLSEGSLIVPLLGGYGTAAKLILLKKMLVGQMGGKKPHWLS